MNARSKITHLSNAWYGYVVFAAAASVLSLRASGVLALAVGVAIWAVFAAIFLAIEIGIVAFLSRRLLARSSATRRFLLLVSGLFTVLGALGALDAGWMFLRSWSFASVVSVVLAVCSTMMNARSFKVLGDTDVKAYCS